MVQLVGDGVEPRSGYVDVFISFSFLGREGYVLAQNGFRSSMLWFRYFDVCSMCIWYSICLFIMRRAATSRQKQRCRPSTVWKHRARLLKDRGDATHAINIRNN
jgi:hypothetical protein